MRGGEGPKLQGFGEAEVESPGAYKSRPREDSISKEMAVAVFLGMGNYGLSVEGSVNLAIQGIYQADLHFAQHYPSLSRTARCVSIF